jgi:predicted MFS family arabinose efflux permease
VALRSFLLIVPLTVAYAWFHSPWAPICIGILEAFVQAAASPAVQSLVARAAPKGRASAAQGLAGATNVITSAGVALAASALYGAHGARVVFGSVAATAALCAATAWFLSRRPSASGAGWGDDPGPALIELTGDLGPDMSPSM